MLGLQKQLKNLLRLLKVYQIDKPIFLKEKLLFENKPRIV